MKIDEQNLLDFKIKMLNWANQFNIFCMLDNNGYHFETTAFEGLLAVGYTKSFSFTNKKSFIDFQQFYDANPTWLFGHLGYNAGEKAYSKSNPSDFRDGFFFEPEIVLQLKNNRIKILKSNKTATTIFAEIENVILQNNSKTNTPKINASIAKEQYLQKVKKLQQHIQQGNCYEINFCQKFEANNISINPIETYLQLCKLSPAPFAALYKLNNNYVICASPERFLKKEKQTLISQPIKGTSKRSDNKTEDDDNKAHLLNSQKEKSENVMVVDLVRNDLSMVCEKGSVKVKELFGIYSFPQIHQMISTVTGILPSNISFTKAIEACFPMGSMTGAPKQKVMELIEQFEETERGLFSGSIGYVTPNADFDFNVVIRSIFYNELKKQLYFFAGSGITANSNAEEEYDECMAKVSAILEVLKNERK